MRPWNLLVPLILFAGCTGGPGPSSEGPGEECRPTGDGAYVYGLVMDVTGTAIAAANVTAKGVGGHDHQVSVESESSGCYDIELPTAMFHDISAAKAGYSTQTESGVALGNGEKRKINFELESA